jgi:hypothetical protein
MPRISVVLASLILVLASLGITESHPSGTSVRASDAGQTFYVNIQDDEADALPNGICETGPGNGVCSLRAAIMEANSVASPGTDTIHLPAGNFVLTRVGVDNTAFNGDLDILDPLLIVGQGAGSTIINGNGNVINDTVFNILGSGGDVTMVGVKIQNGKSIAGGAGGIGNFGFDDTLTLIDCVVQGNTSDPGHGAGILVAAFSKLVLINTTVSGNTASNAGGGISNIGRATLINSTVSGNSSLNWGGGVMNNSAGDPGANLTLINSTVSGNHADRDGGGIYNGDTSAASLFNSTIANNVADFEDNDEGEGGGIFSVGAITLTNTILSGNSHPGPLEPVLDDCKGVLQLQGYNLIRSTTGCTLQNDNSTNLKDVNPNLGVLANNGGPTLTHALTAGSAAIDAANPAGCLDATGAILLTDQRGFFRHVDGGIGQPRCDIGAFEALAGQAMWGFLPLIIR